MVRDAHNAVGDESAQPPGMLGQPADAPAPMGRVGDTESLLTVRRVRANWEAPPRRSLRSWAGRVSGRSDRRLLRALADATAALAGHSSHTALAALPDALLTTGPTGTHAADLVVYLRLRDE